MDFNSIRSKVILLFVPLIVLPLLVSGILGALYFQDTLRHNIQQDNLAQARSLAGYMDTYVPSLVSDINSLATRPYVVNEMASINAANTTFNKTTVIDATLRYGTTNTDFNSLFVTDTSGKVISSYPNVRDTGQYLGNEPYVQPVLSSSNSSIIGPIENESGNPTIFISVPIKSDNGTLLGAMVGELDPNMLGNKILYGQGRADQYIFMVNRTGFIIVHSNKSFMEKLTDFSSVPSVQSVMQGNEGVADIYNPIEQQSRLTAYSPVRHLGWGVIVAVPTSVAYQPVTNILMGIAALTIALIIISMALAYFFSKSIIDPIYGLYDAARAITNRREYKQFLPLKREDEIGQVAVCLDKMAQRIEEDRQKIMGEKNRAELYLDIMGHDINNLNQSALGNLELIRDDANLTPDEKESIEKSISATKSSAGIINNVRSLQKITEEKTGGELQDINDLIMDCINEAPRPKDKKITINYSPRKGLKVRCVPLLKEVFCNMINNSIKHSEQDVTVDITINDTMAWNIKYYEVSVSDNGPGIPDVVKPKLFNRFERGETKAHGKGLGLYIVKSILEKCDGSVKVEDRVPGDYTKGVKFTVTIPAAEDK